MHTSLRLASFALATLVLGTSLATAGGFWDDIAEAGKEDYTPPVIIKVTPKMPHNGGVADAVGDAMADKLPYVGFANVPGAAADGGKPGVLALECLYADAGDLLLVNSGDVALPAGAKVKWEVRSADLKGYLTFKSGFAAGAQFTLSDALDGLDGAAPCAAKPIGL